MFLLSSTIPITSKILHRWYPPLVCTYTNMTKCCLNNYYYFILAPSVLQTLKFSWHFREQTSPVLWLLQLLVWLLFLHSHSPFFIFLSSKLGQTLGWHDGRGGRDPLGSCGPHPRVVQTNINSFSTTWSSAHSSLQIQNRYKHCRVIFS